MITNEFYRAFWAAFAASDFGPRVHSPDIPTPKNGQECYRKFAARWPGNYMLVATANLKQDRLGAEFFAGTAASADALMKAVDPKQNGYVWLRSGARAHTHRNFTDGKVELLFHEAQLKDPAFRPSQFLWLRIALHELAESLGPIAVEMKAHRE